MKRATKLALAAVLFPAALLAGCAAATGSGDSGSSGVVDSGTPPVTPSVTANYFKASNTHAGDNFGWSVSVSADGNTIAVGAPNENSSARGINGNQNDTSMSQAGAVYVFSRAAGIWSQQAYIKASNPEAFDHFGMSVGLSSDGNTLAVGAPGENSSSSGVNGTPNGSATHAGAAYVFVRSGGAWSQQAYLKASNPETGDEFGAALAISSDGDTLAVAARLEDSNATGVNGNQADNSSPDSGAVYVFSRNGAIWAQQAYIKASNTDPGDWFGSSLAISADGNTLSIAARHEDSNAAGINGNQSDNSLTDAGAVYVFTRNAATWSQQAYVKASNPGTGDFFGNSVALSSDGNIMAVDSCCEDSNATGIDGDQTNSKAAGSGAVYLFTRAAGLWTQQHYFKATNTHAGDEFGSPLALSPDAKTILAGAARENSAPNQPPTDQSLPQSGAVFVLTQTASAWSYQRFLKASNADSGDQFGKALALSSAGAIVIGAPFEDSNAIGIGGDSKNNSAQDSGAVYIF